VILLRILRFVFFILIIRLVLRSAGPFFRGKASPAPPRPGRDLVRDQICNTYVLREKAVEAVVGGQLRHFCSTKCRDRALALTQAS
jgi:hypothetical protein